MGVAHFAKKYPPVLDAVLKGVLELTCKYHRNMIEYVLLGSAAMDADTTTQSLGVLLICFCYSIWLPYIT